MELVYLWVEKYKNIDHQGFNFSPRFSCTYDAISKKLQIIDKEQTKEPYLKKIFDEKINITAIVGENGSGKSSILSNIYNPHCKNNASIESENILVFLYENHIKIYSNIHDLKSIPAYEVSSFPPSEFEFFTYHTDLLAPIIIDDYYDYFFVDHSFNNHILHELYKDSNCTLDLYKLHSIVNRLLYKYAHLDNLFLFNPQSMMISLALESLISKEFKSLRLSFENKSLSNEFSSKPTNVYKFLYSFFYKSQKDYKTLFLFYIFFKLYNKNKEIIALIEEDLFEDPDMEFIDLKLDIFEYIQAGDDLNILKENFEIYVELFEKQDFYGKELPIIEQSDSLEKLFEPALQDIINFEFYNEKNIAFSNLSHGERQIVSSSLLLYDRVMASSLNHLIICLDEPDLTLHPQWQKQYICNLIKTFNKCPQKKLHFIITSHSPFLLSDIPKENVIFLENGKQVYPNIETFGANIHTLLSHGFFMKEGLMGEFAKERINKAIEYLNQKELSKEELEYCENIISIVGEPILKRQLQKMLDSKRLAKIDKIDSIQKQIKALEEELKKVQK